MQDVYLLAPGLGDCRLPIACVACTRTLDTGDDLKESEDFWIEGSHYSPG